MQKLETERLLLRPYSASDFDTVFNIFSDPRVTKNLYYGRPLSKTETDAFIGQYMSAFSEDDMLGFGMLILRERKIPIGLAGIAPCQDREMKNGEVEIGFALDYVYQKRGYGKEIAVKLKDWYLNSGLTHPLVALVHPDNLASRGLIENHLAVAEGNPVESSDRGPRLVYFLM